MSLYISIVALLSTISSVKYEMALPIVKDKKKAVNLLFLCLILLTIFSLILSVLLLYFSENIFTLFNIQQIEKFKFILIIGIFFYGLKEILVQWFYREKDYTLISKAHVSQGILGNVSKVLFGVTNIGVIGLLIGQIIKESLSSIIFLGKLLKNEKLLQYFSIKDIKWNLKRFKNYPKYQTPSAFLTIFNNQLPVFSLSIYGSSVVGLYGLANTVVKIPITLLGHSVRNVFYSEAASIGKENPEELIKLSNKVLKKLVVIGVFPFFILLLTGPALFQLVFGSEWTQAGVFSRFLALSVYGNFVFSPVSRVFEVLERQKEKLTIDIFGLVIVLSSFIAARFLSTNPNLAIILYSISMFTYHLTLFIISRFLLNQELQTKNKLK